MTRHPAAPQAMSAVRLGGVPIVEGADARAARRRADRAGRAERRRQDHADARAGRPAAGRRPHRASTAAPLAEHCQRASARARIAYLPQGHVFHWPMPVAAVVALGRHAACRSVLRASTDDDRAAVARALAATATETFATRAGHDAVGRRAGARGAGARAGDAGADPARRRADRLARSAPSARGDGVAARRRARRRRGAGDRARSRAGRALRRPRAGDGSAAASSPMRRPARR